MTGRRLALAAGVLLLCAACGDGDPGGAAGPTTSTPSTPRSTRPVVTRAEPEAATDLCAAREGLAFRTSWLVEVPGASSARGAARPWLAPGEHLGTAPAGRGRRVVSLSQHGRAREVLTVVRQRSGLWLVGRTTGCLTRHPRARACADTVVFHGTTYHRPTYEIPGPTDQIGVGRIFGEGSLPACADVTAYAGPGRYLVGTVAPVTVYQEEEVPMSDSVVTSPVTPLGPRIYDAH